MASAYMRKTHIDGLLVSVSVSIFLFHNLGLKVGDKLMKLSKIGFLWNVVQLLFCDFLPKKRQNMAFGWTAGHSS